MKNQSHRTIPHRLLRLTMRAAILFIFLGASQLYAADAYAQRTSLTIKENNVALRDVIRQVEAGTDFYFFYSNDRIDKDTRVSVNVENGSIYDVLNSALGGTNISYTVNNKAISLSLRAEQQEPQKNRVTGVVTGSSGEALAGVTVTVEGTSAGAVTGGDGRYSIAVPGDDTILSFSFLGYIPQRVAAGNTSVVDIILQQDLKILDEVVVVGYGTQLKKDITGAVSTVSARDIENIPVTDFGAALAGRTAGVQVVSASGKPSDGFSIRVRGATSISAGSDPLYIVDGVPTTDTKAINPSEIESITILKDASSAAIYGNAGANGVVIITTKMGMKGESRIDFNAYYGVSLKPRKIDVLNAGQYEELLNEMGYPAIDRNIYNGNVDWQDEMFRMAPMQNYQLSFSGGTDKMTYYVSGGYIQQDGIIKPSSFERMNLKVNIDYQVKKWMKLGANVAYSRIKDVDVSDGNSETVVLQALTTPSIVPLRNADGTYPTLPFLSSLENPLAGIEAYDRNWISNSILAYVYGEISFTRDLKFKSSLGIESGYNRYKEFLDPFSTAWGVNQQGQSTYNSAFSYKWINENLLTYSKSIGEHGFSVLGGFILSRYESEGADVAIRGFASNKIKMLGAGTVLSKPIEYYAANSNVSAIVRGTYDYAGKYLATVNFRADGSSKFGRDSRWGYFPSFSLGWRLTGEEFLKDVPWLYDLKLRVGWGQVGNDQVGDYSSYGIYGIGANYNYDGKIVPGYYQSQIGNSKLRWEKTSQTNIGIDFSAFEGRINATADAYYKKTTDLLLSVKLPETTGFDSGMQNVGSVENKGIEFQLNTRNLVGEFKWTTDFNISYNHNEVVDMADTPAIYTGGLDKKISGNTSIVQTGSPMGTFYGYQAVGVDPANGRMLYEKANGMLAYQDELNPDTDRRVIGCAQPKLLYGIGNTFSWKGIDLSIFLQGSYGNDIYNATRMFTEGMFDSRNQSAAVLMRWRTPGDYTTIPAPDKDKYPVVSSRFVEDGSYLKIKSIKLSYTLPQNLTRKALMERITVYASAENAYTFTNYSGYDPEASITGGSATAMGIDQGVFPHASTYILGLNIVF